MKEILEQENQLNFARWSREAKAKQQYSHKIGLNFEKEYEGIVVEVHRRTNRIFSIQENQYFDCKLHSNFNLKDFNQIAVGDKVSFEKTKNRTGFITQIYARETIFYRPGPQDRKNQKLILAANIDQVVVLFSFDEPCLKVSLLDRYLVRLSYLRIPFIVGINKHDLKTKSVKGLDHLQYLQKQGLPLFFLSCKTKQGLNVFLKKMERHRNLITGPSGVGKSSLIQYLFPQDKINIKQVSHVDKKGKHTTIASKLYFFKKGYLIDSPGIRELAFWDLNFQDIAYYFFDWSQLLFRCKFRNCLHDKELGCFIKERVAKNIIPKFRYEHYLKILRDKKREESLTQF